MQMNLNPLEQLDPLVIVVTALILLATFVVLKRIYVVPYVRVMEERALHLEAAEEQRAEGRRLHEEADGVAETSLADARDEADELRRASAQSLERYRAEALSGAARTASGRLEEGRARIRALRADERGSLREHAVDCVGLACGRLIGEVDRDEIASVVDDLLVRMGSGGDVDVG